MQLWSKKNLSGAGALVVAMMMANLLNFAFNAFLGRQLSYEQFGIVTFYNTILYLSAIIFSGLSSSINHRTAYLNGKYNQEAGASFTVFVRNRSYLIGAVLVGLWLVLTPVFARLFQIEEVWSLIYFSPVFVFGLISFVNRGYLQGNLHFVSVAVIILSEALVKLLAAAALVFLGYDDLVYLSVPLSLLAAFVVSVLLTSRKFQSVGVNSFRFPKRFFTAAVITGLSSAAFLSIDVILAKHFLKPDEAGQYAILALVGKMVFFLGSLLNGFMITFVSHDVGERKNTTRTFYRLLGATLVLTTAGVIFFGYLGHITIPFLLGDKITPVLPYLASYALAIGIFTIASVIIIYHLALEQYVFSVASFGLSAALAAGIMLRHDSIGDFTRVILAVSITSLAVMTLLHFMQRNGRFVIANLISMLDIFMPLPKQDILGKDGKRILVMNWRDTKHKRAGGAEVYVHEMARRWVKAGHQVTVFCGNDGMCLNNEIVDGVRIVRRGGFYTVYPWAFVYYFTKFRGRFDMIIDCQNGIPFFTPIYAREKVFSVLHHVHQEVFYKFLPRPLAWFAAMLENRVMPYVYRNVQFITISPSSRQEMQHLEISGLGIEIIYCGVDIKNLKPGPKHGRPMVLHVGRLKAYKSVDVLIRAFKEIAAKVTDAVLVIAGSGEEEKNLKSLAEEMGLADKVEFRGKITEEEKISLMQQAWVFVNPSMMEGWGITTIEAGACATPVVASNVPGLRDSVKNPHTGFLVPYGDASAFADKITLLLEDPQLRQSMSDNAVVWAKNFSWDKSSENFLSLLSGRQETFNKPI